MPPVDCAQTCVSTAIAGHNNVMDDRRWCEAMAVVASELAAESRSESRDVHRAEVARVSLADRRGPASVRLRSGRILDVEFVDAADAADAVDAVDAVDADDAVAGHIVVRQESRQGLLRASAVVSVVGTRPSLRPDGPEAVRPLAAWLREVSLADVAVQALDCTGTWVRGRLATVARDHAEIFTEGRTVCLSLEAVDLWWVV